MSVLPNNKVEPREQEGSTTSEQTSPSDPAVLTPDTMSEMSIEEQYLSLRGTRSRIENQHEISIQRPWPMISLASVVLGILLIPTFLFLLKGPPRVEYWLQLGDLSISFELMHFSGSTVPQSPAQMEALQNPSESRAQQVWADEIDDRNLLERILDISRPTQDEKRALNLITTQT